MENNTAAIKTPSAFDLFVQLVDNKLPNGRYVIEMPWCFTQGTTKYRRNDSGEVVRQWTYRGDKYTDDPHKQMLGMLKLANTIYSKCHVIILRDNRKKEIDELGTEKPYTVLKIIGNKVLIDLRDEYKHTQPIQSTKN